MRGMHCLFGEHYFLISDKYTLPLSREEALVYSDVISLALRLREMQIDKEKPPCMRQIG